MPSKSEEQRKLVYTLRNKYKLKKTTPKKYLWIWEKGWEKIK